MDSLNHFSPPTTFLCPRLRYKKQMDPETYFIEKQTDPSLEESHRLSFFDSVISKLYSDITYLCDVCSRKINYFTDFWCDKCDQAYHKECVESPPEIKVPYHPKHPLQLLFSSPKSTLPVGSSHYNKCNCCGENTHEGIYYSCSICDFNLHPVCAINLSSLSINYPKRHEHTLTYFPRVNSLTCDVCALGNDKHFIYVCYQCDFIVHNTCIYLPTTIRISRHYHRLSFIAPITNKNNWSCGVCHQRVDKNYGKYSCVKDCDYVVHSKCATREDLWDGKELEGEPEVEYEDIKAFKEIRDRVIKHVSHPYHNMRLDKKENGRVEVEKWCRACILPIYEGNIYSCMRCEFILHETCAHLPRKKWHPLHAHPLTLQVSRKFECKFECVACENHCCGFAYTCYEGDCSFQLDVRCALVSEPFTHQLHPHPLFLTSGEGGIKLRRCSMCGKEKQHLSCIECSNFVFCFRCATLLYKVKYKHEEHYNLTLPYKEDTGGYNWCDICEKEIYPHVGFYTCDSLSNITVHIECLLGVDPFMNHGQHFVINGYLWVWIIPNDGLTREICVGCGNHCLYRIAYEAHSLNRKRLLLCSMECLCSVLELPYNYF
ncbi:unnamed protein product [Eruca vesicaria subsp. sativa]|uniref:Cysteine/Histidine-rich C1 domain family protein n=1 Tax=Eruca vesicaria subsp. sativa TaxID=29727 RepID=A0ABC8M525_ERUVS|nr:unnamed protein product [Eruca vesicaria subsp. sativa]